MTLRELHTAYFGGDPQPLWWTLYVCATGVVPYTVTFDALRGRWPTDTSGKME